MTTLCTMPECQTTVGCQCGKSARYVNAYLDKPREEDNLPAAIEDAAAELFRMHSAAITGHEWIWADATREVKNVFRIKAMKTELLEAGYVVAGLLDFPTSPSWNMRARSFLDRGKT